MTNPTHPAGGVCEGGGEAVVVQQPRERERGRRGEMMTMVMLERLWCGGDDGSDGVGAAVVGDDVGVIVWWWWRGDTAETAGGGWGERREEG
ncbi:hypothetical protein Tco_0989726 [Tanacetum coccineum]|uniref:Uncharacterized protein n=1 Tax=Tanacetum coccineum TaxID=301880 RepID=A0ABQ5EW12_9ASTR